MVKEIVWIGYGDSKNASTWSNVPYLFTKTLEEKKIKVDRIDISANHTISRLYDRIIYPIFRPIFGLAPFGRTYLLYAWNLLKIKRQMKRFPNAEYCIISSFDYYNKFSKAQTILYGDWTYDTLLERQKKKPSFWDRRFINQQKLAINKADIVISLFAECAKHIKEIYPLSNVHYLNTYFINSLYEEELDPKLIIKRKRESKSILFIGKKIYKETADKVIEAFKLLRSKDSSLSLNIIGMVKSDFDGNIPEGINFYGFLHKDIKLECDTYYKLLLDATIIANPNPVWGGYSSIVEAMYFYTPILVAPYKDFKQEFGENINFGIYNAEYTAECIAKNIMAIMESSEFNTICMNAHERVKDYTWSNYVDKILDLLE